MSGKRPLTSSMWVWERRTISKSHIRLSSKDLGYGTTVEKKEIVERKSLIRKAVVLCSSKLFP